MSKRTYLEAIQSFDEKQMAQFISKIYLCGQKGGISSCRNCGLFLCCPPEVIENSLKMDECFDLLKRGGERA
ncbi:MAG: hypothetical protein ACLSUP_02735 [Blautia massiliensis (ex Durand et al. 2017)]|uniref:hypothetical protein n=1 Tax=Blautia massiliensis (ex Durand et al. 2017) TaxID=1737424 RepID=UPI003996B529